jgi:hypothetical protein
MSESNGSGILKVGRRGLRKMQYDDNTPVVELDILHVSNQWAEIDAEFRNDKGEILPNKNGEYLAAAVRFASAILQVPMPMQAAPGLSLPEQPLPLSIADAFHFLKLINDESEKLKPFFVIESAAKPSSPSSSEVAFLE